MGRSCSKCCSPVVAPTAVAFDPLPIATTRITSPRPMRMVENCIVLWLSDDSSKTFENEIEQLRRFVYGFQVFINLDTCIDYIRDVQDEKIFLITSIPYQSIGNVYHFPQLEKIYIFDSSSPEDTKSNLLNNIFRDINNLCKQLQQDIELCELDLTYFSAIPNSSDDIKSSTVLTKEQASFVFIRIINEIMIRMKFDNNSKNVLIDFCRIHYANNDEQLRIIDEFTKYYRPNQAFDWLKRPCFISKILKRIKRTREIDLLYKIGFFAKHLSMRLIKLHEENALQMKNISVVYRSKTMLNDEFELLIKNHCDGLLSFADFLGTTVNKENAIDFICRRLTMHPNRIAIIFEIHLDHTIFNEDSPFALLKSNDWENGEIYFFAGTVFRIKSIEQVMENSVAIWCIKLQLIGNDDPQLLRILAPFRTHEQHENPLSCLGKLLMEMGEYRRVEQFFLEMLNDPAILNQPRRLVRVRNGLGANYAHKGDYETALIHYEKALKVSLTYLPSDHSDLALAYKNIADCYLNRNNYNYALQNYEQAIHLITSNTQSPSYSILIELQILASKTKHLIEDNK